MFKPNPTELKALALRVCGQGAADTTLDRDIAVALQFVGMYEDATNVRALGGDLEFEHNGETTLVDPDGFTYQASSVHELYERFTPQWGYRISRPEYGLYVTCRMEMDPMPPVECTTATFECAFLGACLLAMAAQVERDAAKQAALA